MYTSIILLVVIMALLIWIYRLRKTQARLQNGNAELLDYSNTTIHQQQLALDAYQRYQLQQHQLLLDQQTSIGHKNRTIAHLRAKLAATKRLHPN